MPVKTVTFYDDRGNPAFQCYTNLFVVSKERYSMKDDSKRRELYYLSLFGPKGSGTSLSAIFAALVNSSVIREVYIEDIGPIALAHKSGRFPEFTPSWSMEISEFGVNKALHAVIESKALTLWDPSQATMKAKKVAAGDDDKAKQRASKSDEMSDKVAQSLERNPIFSLLVPPYEDAQSLFLAYLDKRCPFPLHDEWSQFIWDYSMENKRVEQLEVWNAGEPIISEGYLCFPNLEKLINALSTHIKSQSLDEVAA